MFREQPYVTWAIWTILVVDAVFATVTQRWSGLFIALSAFLITLMPAIFVSRFRIRLPSSFLGAISIFVFCTLFLGEVYDFYEKYWWWDVLLHGGSAVGFGLIGFLFVFYMFEGDRYAAPPIALAFVAFCFAVTIGTGWEIFEFAMDQFFGTNMQKSGLTDTMGDLIVDMIGATIGAASGFLYLKGREVGGLPGMISEFLRLNRDLFTKLGERRRDGRRDRH